MAGLTLLDWVLLTTAGLVGFVLLHPHLMRQPAWRATVTPLASIIGSGFLVIAPLLADVAGSRAVAAMGLIVLVALAIGHVIRFNIRHAEPLLAGEIRHPGLALSERLSGIALIFAYVISVAFYIRILGSFALARTPWNGELHELMLATVILAGIGIVGFVHGLKGLEFLEVLAVSTKLAVIVALLVGLLWHDVARGEWFATVTPGQADLLTRLRMLGGMLLVVQGFETSRYLGSEYPADLRARTMFWAQILSGAIYIGFVVLVEPLLADLPPGRPDETAIIRLTAEVARVLPWLLILGALMSQFSAGVADTLGAGGLAHEASGGRVQEKWAYPAIAAVAIVLIWSLNVFEVIAVASRAFAAYYMLQALTAFFTVSITHCGHSRRWAQLRFLAMAFFLLLIVLFALPVE